MKMLQEPPACSRPGRSPILRTAPQRRGARPGSRLWRNYRSQAGRYDCQSRANSIAFQAVLLQAAAVAYIPRHGCSRRRAPSTSSP